jgi:hypothetical protein
MGDEAAPKSISRVQFSDIFGFVHRLNITENFQQEHLLEENSALVCIAAAGSSETAWEYRNAQGQWCGVMTEALLKVVISSNNRSVSWKATLMRVSELVNVRFPYRHPCVTGPRDRFHFSLLRSSSQAYQIRNEPDGVVLMSGRFSGVHVGSIYTVMEQGANRANVDEQIAEARVTHVQAFSALLELSFPGSKAKALPDDGAIAFLHALLRWPVSVPSGFSWLEMDVNNSRWLRPQESEEQGFLLATFRCRSNDIVICDNHDLEVPTAPIDPSPEERLKVMEAAEQLARARHLLSLGNESPEETLQHKVRTEVTLVENRLPPKRIIRLDGTDSLTEGNHFYICL